MAGAGAPGVRVGPLSHRAEGCAQRCGALPHRRLGSFSCAPRRDARWQDAAGERRGVGPGGAVPGRSKNRCARQARCQRHGGRVHGDPRARGVRTRGPRRTGRPVRGRVAWRPSHATHRREPRVARRAAHGRVRAVQLQRLERRDRVRLRRQALWATARQAIPDRVRGARRPPGELREPVDLPLERAGLRRWRLRGGDDRLSRLARLRPGVHRLHQPRLGREAPHRPAEGTRGRDREVPVARRGARLCARCLLRGLHDELDRGPLAGSLPLHRQPRRPVRPAHHVLRHRGAVVSRVGAGRTAV